MNKYAAAKERIDSWRADPVLMVRELWPGTTPDWWQAEALRAFADRGIDHIALQACAGPGKSTVLNWIGWNFQLCYAEKDHHPTGFVMSVTGDNLRDNLWKEMAVWYGQSSVLQKAFSFDSQRIASREFPKTWWLVARTFAKTATPDEQGRTLSGLHGKYILYLIDESGDIPTPVLRTAEQGLSTAGTIGKIVQAGNPTSTTGMLYAASSEQAHLWHFIRITGDPDDPHRSPRISKQWAQEQIGIYGRDNAWVMAFILGLFPPGGLNTLIGPDEVRDAMKRHLRTDEYDFVQKRIGVDVARFGDDLTVMFPRQGLAAFKPVVMRGARTDAIAARLMAAKDKWGSEVEMIDDTGGWAGGVIDSCLLAGVTLYPSNASGKSTNPRYFNKRSENWFELVGWIKRGGALPYIPELVPELSKPTYTFRDGKFWLQEKDQIKALLKRSPDHADALALTFSLPDMPAQAVRRTMYSADLQHSEFEYDPFSQQAGVA